MKISVWQQFASNHSAFFTIVGEFESADEAKASSEKIQNIIDELFAWIRVHEAEWGRSKVPSPAPSPIERHFAELYGFDWKEHLDRIQVEIIPVDRLVVIDSDSSPTWQSGHQYANLLRAMHGKVARSVMEGREPGVDGEIWESMGITINANASPEDADRLVKELQLFSDLRYQRYESYSIPWLVYHPESQSFTHDQIRVLEAQYLAGQNSLTPDKRSLIWNYRRVIDVNGLTAGQTPQGIEIRNINFASIPIGFPAFMEYIRNNGCTNIQYSIQQGK